LGLVRWSYLFFSQVRSEGFDLELEVFLLFLEEADLLLVDLAQVRLGQLEFSLLERLLLRACLGVRRGPR